MRVIGVEGKNLGIMSLEHALALAREADLDLVEVGPHENPPVCRILDYGKFKYELQKKQRAQAHHTKVKEIHLRPGTGRHDLEVKIQRAREFLNDLDKVLVVVQFKGREAAHIEEGMRVVQTVIDAVADLARVENPPRNEGKQRIVCMLAPRPELIRQKEKEKTEKRSAKEPTSLGVPGAVEAKATQTTAAQPGSSSIGPQSVQAASSTT